MGRRDRIRGDFRNGNYDRLDTKYNVPKTISSDSWAADEANYCVELDNLVKSLEVIVATESKKQIQEDNRASKRSTIEAGEYLTILREILEKRKTDFTNTKCAAKIENVKLLETKDIISKELKTYDADVLDKSNEERTRLLVVGGIVLLSAFSIILFAKSKK